MSQRLQYLSSGLYYLNGLIILIDMLMPLIFLFFGIKPVTSSTISFAFYFIPFMFLNMLTLYLVSDKNITFRALAFSQSSFTLQLSALISALTGRKDKFTITAKKALSGNFAYLAYPHLFYTAAAFVAAGVALFREGLNPSVVTNLAWAFFNVALFYPFIKASFASQSESLSVTNKADTNSFPFLLGEG